MRRRRRRRRRRKRRRRSKYLEFSSISTQHIGLLVERGRERHLLSLFVEQGARWRQHWLCACCVMKTLTSFPPPPPPLPPSSSPLLLLLLSYLDPCATCQVQSMPNARWTHTSLYKQTSKNSLLLLPPPPSSSPPPPLQRTCCDRSKTRVL